MAGSRDGRKLTIEVVGDTKSIKKDVAEINKTIGGLDKKAKTAATALGGLFVVDKVVDFAKATISAASDLQESMSKVKVVFGDSADEIISWSRTSVNAMGMSQQAALEAAGTFGNLFDSLGLAEKASVDMSTGIVQLAADLASFNNVGTEETLLALRSGLLGEAEPMRKFGSALSAARVEAYALAQGIVKNKSALTEAQKVQIRYKLMVEDTKNAQGDFARSSNNAAAQQKKLDANMANRRVHGLAQRTRGPQWQRRVPRCRSRGRREAPQGAGEAGRGLQARSGRLGTDRHPVRLRARWDAEPRRCDDEGCPVR
jgi:hypothetical protein